MDLPDDMPAVMKAQLLYDCDVFGTALYEETDDGYHRIDPLDIVIGTDGDEFAVFKDGEKFDSEGVEVLSYESATDYYGKPPIAWTFYSDSSTTD